MYKLVGTESVKRISDGAHIPFADGNRDYEEYKQWLAEGNEPEPEFTEEELARISLNKAIQEAQSLLDSTQFKFGEDYDKKYTSEWLELKAKRQEAREFIRLHSS